MLLLLTMLQMLVQNLQLLYHNRQQQVDMENDMNYMLLNPPRGINRRATMATMFGVFFAAFGVFCGESYYTTYRPGICTTASPVVSCERKTFLKTNSVRKRYRVHGV